MAKPFREVDAPKIRYLSDDEARPLAKFARGGLRGVPGGGGGDQSHAFFVLTMAPQLGQAYLPTLTNMGPG
jgi:hypothetical protein